MSDRGDRSTFVQRHPILRHVPILIFTAVWVGYLAGHLAAAIAISP